MQQTGELYRKRQAIVEHPFGIIKRQWDFYYIMTKQGMARASADVGLIFTAFNLRRIFNIIDPNMLKKFLKELGFIFSILRSQFKAFYDTFFVKNGICSLNNSLFKMPEIGVICVVLRKN